jgi:hypothetical protein
MADLSAAQLLTIRRRIGDNKLDNASAYELPDATIEAIFDDTTMGDSDLLKTTVWCLRERWGMAINLVTLTGEFGNAKHVEKQEAIKKLLDYWEGVAGMTGGQTLGSTATNTYRADSRQTEEPDYSSGTASDGDRYIVINY